MKTLESKGRAIASEGKKTVYSEFLWASTRAALMLKVIKKVWVDANPHIQNIATVIGSGAASFLAQKAVMREWSFQAFQKGRKEIKCQVDLLVKDIEEMKKWEYWSRRVGQ